MTGKPSLFIGSSAEALDVAYTFQEAMEWDAEPTVWSQGVFQPSQYAIADLVVQARRCHYAVFVVAPDDVVVVRGQAEPTARDNVIFELGLFIGSLGPERCFVLQPRDVSIHLPSDLLGLQPLTYAPDRQDGNLLAALGPAAQKLRRIFREEARIGPILKFTQERQDWKPDQPLGPKQLADRYIETWNSEELRAPRELLRRGVPGHAMEDEDGAATAAIRKVFVFLDSVADAVQAGQVDENDIRQALGPALVSFWRHASIYLAPPNQAAEWWDPMPAIALLANRWATP